MHWYIPTQLETPGVGGTFYVNACLATGERHTEAFKNVTCKRCKAIYAYPHTPELMAAKLYNIIIAEQWRGREEHFSIEVRCNCCESDLDVFGWLDETFANDLIARTVHFLNHVAHSHSGGAEVLLSRHYNPFSAYAINYGMGKRSATQHESAWREREGLAIDPSDVGRVSLDARLTEGS